jgi:hypothetical protein
VAGLTVRRAKFRSVEIEDLTVRRLRLIEAMPSSANLTAHELIDGQDAPVSSMRGMKRTPHR